MKICKLLFQFRMSFVCFACNVNNPAQNNLIVRLITKTAIQSLLSEITSDKERRENIDLAEGVPELSE